MKHYLQLKLSQHLTLTPQLQQAIRLLQLSTLELNQEIEQFLQENPLLEREEEDESASVLRCPSETKRKTGSSAMYRAQIPGPVAQLQSRARLVHFGCQFLTQQ